jgi:acyl dehydratase
MSTASTRILPDFGRTIVSLGYDRIRFLKPVYINDTVTVDYEIVKLDVDRERTIAKVEVRNQSGELVAIATHIQKLID